MAREIPWLRTGGVPVLTLETSAIWLSPQPNGGQTSAKFIDWLYTYIYIYLCMCMYVCIYIYIYIGDHYLSREIGHFGAYLALRHIRILNVEEPASKKVCLFRRERNSQIVRLDSPLKNWEMVSFT